MECYKLGAEVRSGQEICFAVSGSTFVTLSLFRAQFFGSDVGDTRMRLRGTKGKEGEGNVGAAVALTVLFGPIGLIKHGKNVEVKQGTPLLAYVDQDFTVPPPQ
jgi:hypothetical protein